ncbi:hypothetical protein JIN85_17110 [Luteolibacter pohnpeiensis]|uniref:Uncharacterized protein n=1 Tax=Luteolibacter pohnpeiensis TaxID=454153 RepID=A0A934S980_9BACT|nr:hypothetical protein [Luteolibacter pohnpeiensis]MBK1884143.1 hypothetical protein [Luteolibacter pohnpeiensis]
MPSIEIRLSHENVREHGPTTPVDVSESLIVEEIIINNSKSTRMSGESDLDKRSKPPAIRFCLLALNTYLVRLNRRKLGASNGIIVVPEKYRNSLKQLWETKSDKNATWKDQLFDSDPFVGTPPFLMNSGSRTNFNVYIAPDIDIEINAATDQTKISPEGIRRLMDKLNSGANTPDKISIKIKSRSFELSSDDESGYLYKGARVQVVVERTFDTHLVVFWINSNNQLSLLYSDAADFRSKYQAGFLTSKDQTILTIPKNEEFEVKTPKGSETCIVLESRATFRKGAMAGIAKKIESSLIDRDKTLQLKKTSFRRFPIEHKIEGNPLRLRLELPEQPDTWQQKILEACSGIRGSLCIYDIPNR